VHRKKDAKDWGVEPHIAVPLDDDAERKVMIELDQHERYLPPVPKSSTQPATRSATQPTSSDVQLQRAMDTMIGMIVLDAARSGGGLIARKTDPPTPQPKPEVEVGGPNGASAPGREIIPANKVAPSSDEFAPKGATTKPTATRPAPAPTKPSK
jgi:hypothetical protein